MTNQGRIFFAFSFVFSAASFATGLNFWESSTVNSALASANGANANDASLLALAPSSMVWLDSPSMSVNVTYYQVDTDYDIFGMQSDYSKSDPIPAGFFTFPISQNWYFGMGAYSRTAADISIPKITVFFPETRVRPIAISFAPSVAYRWNNVSLALSLEYQHSEYILEQNRCNLFGNCELKKVAQSVGGFSGAISASWRPNSRLAFAATHRLESDYKDSHIAFDLPSITSLYASVNLLDSLTWHSSFSYSRWSNKGIKYTEYSDFIGLLKGFSNSKRFATSFEYRLDDFTFMAGVSRDEVVDSFGGDDLRYRLGLSYQLTPKLGVDIAGFKEVYSKKFMASSIGNVEVQNQGQGLSLGLSYRF